MSMDTELQTVSGGSVSSFEALQEELAEFKAILDARRVYLRAILDENSKQLLHMIERRLQQQQAATDDENLNLEAACQPRQNMMPLPQHNAVIRRSSAARDPNIRITSSNSGTALKTCLMLPDAFSSRLAAICRLVPNYSLKSLQMRQMVGLYLNTGWRTHAYDGQHGSSSISASIDSTKLNHFPYDNG